MDKREYPWYDIADNDMPLRQGELIQSCPIIIPISLIELEHENGEIEEQNGAAFEVQVGDHKIKLKLRKFDVVIMSQSCDLEPRKNGKVSIEPILVCPTMSYSKFAEWKGGVYKGNSGKEALIRGLYPKYHLLNQCDKGGFENECMVVDFTQVYGVPYDYLVNYVKDKPRLCLLPPYREHLSQSFARFFMRVGLPVGIDKTALRLST